MQMQQQQQLQFWMGSNKCAQTKSTKTQKTQKTLKAIVDIIIFPK
jgi:hypothetical protein